MNFHTEGLLPPQSIPEADYVRRQAEIAKCLADFRERWSAPEPLAEVIQLRAGPDFTEVNLSQDAGFHAAG